jgi:hypothetical protein
MTRRLREAFLMTMKLSAWLAGVLIVGMLLLSDFGFCFL